LTIGAASTIGAEIGAVVAKSNGWIGAAVVAIVASSFWARRSKPMRRRIPDPAMKPAPLE
jgi:hypothetical protein